MSFSGGVKLGDLDDFIAASQECVKPLIEAASGNGSAKIGSTGTVGAAALGTRIAAVETPQVQRPNLIKTKQSKEDPKAQIAGVTLSDCLACSGCVTSAETVLLQAQSGEEFLRRVAEAPLTVVTISGESRTSIAAHCGAAPLLTMRRIAAVLREMGVAYVLESSAAEAIALLEAKEEFARRFRESRRPGGGHQGAVLPFLTSHCPGWTCYAEKVVDPAVLKHMAPLRPPQEVQGRLVKTCLLEAHNRRRLHRWWRWRSPLFALEGAWWLRGLPLPGGATPSAGPAPLEPRDVYHVCVQPCFDRKLEAARPGFELDGHPDVREVDTVLATTELLELFASRSPTAGSAKGGAEVLDGDASDAARALSAARPCDLDDEVLTDLLLGGLGSAERAQPLLCNVRGNAGSGGYLEYVFREAASELLGARLPLAPLELRPKQNEDMREVVYRDPSTGEPLMLFVAAYGFRNIQNVIRRVQRASAELGSQCGHFVEIMACPGGCLNGGGQVPQPKGSAPRSQIERRTRLAELEGTLVAGEGTATVEPAEHPLVPELYARMAGEPGRGGEAPAERVRRLVGSPAARRWLSAEWRSLKVDVDGNDVVGTSVLKW
mmetsp:Transcript_77234/g.218950  ORF Transcript_77234/g.218950 Transcript_77234/m.218950 type:complete len:605 (-) Transcript_77234:213-2027(-)